MSGKLPLPATLGLQQLKDVCPCVSRAAADKAMVGFGSVHYSVMESAGTAKVVITRAGALDLPVVVQYTTKDGTVSGGRYTIAAVSTL